MTTAKQTETNDPVLGFTFALDANGGFQSCPDEPGATYWFAGGNGYNWIKAYPADDYVRKALAAFGENRPASVRGTVTPERCVGPLDETVRGARFEITSVADEDVEGPDWRLEITFTARIAEVNRHNRVHPIRTWTETSAWLTTDELTAPVVKCFHLYTTAEARARDWLRRSRGDIVSLTYRHHGQPSASVPVLTKAAA